MTGYSSCHSCSITVIVDCYSLAPGHSKKMPMHIQMAFFIEALGISILVRIVIAQKLAWAPPNILQNTNDVDSIFIIFGMNQKCFDEYTRDDCAFCFVSNVNDIRHER